MMNNISKLSKIDANANSKSSMRFNGSLPITIEVLKNLGMDRYKLLLGTKEFTTKSQKKLERGAKYWGSFGEGKAGIITISNLIKKPNFLQNNSGFLDIELSEFLAQIAQVESPISTFKEWLIENLENDDTKKDKFIIFSDILLALKEDIIHLPLKHNGKTTLLQIKLGPSYMEFYCAFENLGPMNGYISKGVFNLNVLFDKTFYFLKKSNIASNISILKPIEPLYNSDKLILDLKG
ncbi:MAG TPA: hypothetical protein EYG93_01010 [Sulfurospirillum arcachonense]|nr:hypothetical protein [Sulfurospirillum arcachonense]HIP43901.1 hypothetical protein [Sulfurospirillum arcachonense]